MIVLNERQATTRIFSKPGTRPITASKPGPGEMEAASAKADMANSKDAPIGNSLINAGSIAGQTDRIEQHCLQATFPGFVMKEKAYARC